MCVVVHTYTLTISPKKRENKIEARFYFNFCWMYYSIYNTTSIIHVFLLTVVYMYFSVRKYNINTRKKRKKEEKNGKKTFMGKKRGIQKEEKGCKS